MNELIVIKKKTIGEEEVNAVNARELHKFLGSKQEYATWIKNRIKQYDFVQGTDFTTFDKVVKQVSGAKTLKEYIISIDMAKELSMVERNSKGKEARRYFIKMEKIAKGVRSNAPSSLLEEELKIFALLEVPKHLAQIESVKKVHKDTGVDLSYALLSAPAQNNIKKTDVMLEPTELGKHFGVSAVKMNRVMEGAGLQVKTMNGWEPTEKGSRMSMKHAWSSGAKSGYNYKWSLSQVEEAVN